MPIAIKNNRAVRGLRLTQGAALMRDFIAPYDHSVVTRLRRAGFVIVGTTKLPEFGILPVTEPALHGPARNPWDLERTAGGSSGGSAAISAKSRAFPDGSAPPCLAATMISFRYLPVACDFLSELTSRLASNH